MAASSAIDEEIADELGINRETFHNWKKRLPELANAVKAAKEAADDRTERSLYRRANGYSHPAVKFLTVSDGEGMGTHIETMHYTEHYPPDTTAASSGSRTGAQIAGATCSSIEAEHAIT